MTPDQQDWQDELREQIQGARHMAEVSPDLVRRALIHMDAAVREVGRQLYAATERVQHLLTTIDVERTGRKEAEEEVVRLNAMRTHCEHCGADYMATGVEAGYPCRLAGEVARLRGALEFYAERKHYFVNAYHEPRIKDLGETARAALHAQDTDDEPRAICRHNIVADECGICDDLSRAAEVGR